MTEVFGFKMKKTHEEYVGTWVHIYSGIGNFSGKFLGVEDGCYVLNPFLKNKHTTTGIEKNLTSENLKIGIIPAAIEPTTKTDILNFCAQVNKKNQPKQK